MIRVGEEGDVGVAQLSDFVFTVAEVLPGAVLVEVNMKGAEAGDVGLWNCHFRVGGARGSKITREGGCADPKGCLAARLALHLTRGASAYVENVWAWTADHDLDGKGGEVYPGTGGGFLIEAERGTWILGAGVEHHVLYQVNIHNARNVFIGLQEGESAYWQGAGNKLLAPEPWGKSLWASDPDFSWCAVDAAQVCPPSQFRFAPFSPLPTFSVAPFEVCPSQLRSHLRSKILTCAVQCRMGLYQVITNSTDLNLYSSGFWNFVAGPSRTMCANDCQDNAVLYQGNSRVHIYGLSTINNKNMIVERSQGSSGSRNGSVGVTATRAANAGLAHDGFKTGIVAAYLRMSG